MMDLRWKAGITGVVVAAGAVVAAAGPAQPGPHHHAALGPRAGSATLLGSAIVAPRPAASAPPGPVSVDVLRATTAHLTDTGHNVTMKTIGAVTTGSVDPARRITAVAISEDGVTEFVEMVVHGTVYVRMDIDPTTNDQMGVDPKTWMRLDGRKIAADSALPLLPTAVDPVDMPGILDGVTAVKRVDATNYVGTIDLAKVDGHNRPDPIEVQVAGKPATRAPFRLTTDDQGRIAQFSVNTNGFDPTLSLDVSFTNYGTQDTVTPPGSSVPAPASVYALFKP
ncbi:MAG TPA: hypothetical protein VKB69_13465 [Micromonosporaceae bacterium]|nr:hypothetical protein [Micromonosporaceae bacterium]